MKFRNYISLLFLLAYLCSLHAQDCIPISAHRYQACINTVEVQHLTLDKLKQAPAETLQGLYYQYFAGKDYTAYKHLFLSKDWYNLSVSEFNSWHATIDPADLILLGLVEVEVAGNLVGIAKYSFVMGDMLMYETFIAKKIGTHWYPSSVSEEQEWLELGSFIKYTDIAFLNSAVSSIRKGNVSARSIDVVEQNKIDVDRMMTSKDSLKIFDPEKYSERYTNEFEYLTNTKYDEDRTHDTTFIKYLTEMQLTPDQIDIVIKFIKAQDYINAAQRADTYSPVSYTFAPFVDKIREVYGIDRLKKWDSVNHKWN